MRNLAFLALLVLSVSSISEVEISQSLSAARYDGFRLFIQGFMTTFEGPTYTVPTACFDQSVYQKLDGDLVASFFSLGKGEIKESYRYLEIFNEDLYNAMVTCGASQIPKSYEYTIKTNGKWKMFNDIIFHFVDFEADLLGVFGDLVLFKYQQAGVHLGNLMKIFLIPAPLQLLSAAVSPNTQAFVNGLLTGLEANPSQPDACYTAWTGLNSGIFLLAADVEAMNIKNIFADFESLQKAYAQEASECSYDGLALQLQKIMGPDGAKILLQNYVSNGGAIYQNVLTFTKCSGNLQACGAAVGSIFRLSIGWSLQ